MADPGTEQRRLSAIMFTDMVGYTALTHRNEALALEILEEQRRLLRGLLPPFGGREVETTGDGFLIQFASALEAARCALAIQEAVGRQNETVAAERRYQLRIGIHVGDVVEREGQVLGAAVNVAARLQPLAKPGAICLSQQVLDQVQPGMQLSVRSLGQVILKNVPVPVAVYEVDPLHPSVASGSGAPPSARPSVAVLPFVNMSSDRENEYFSDGITEDLITALSQVPGLRVPARTSAFAFKGRNEDIRHIGQLLGVGHVLEGSVRMAGQKLRVTAQLVGVDDGCHVWSERFDRPVRDVFEIQDEITRAIVSALRVQFGAEAGSDVARGRTSSPEAYRLYLRGRECWNQRGLGLRKALHYFELALLEDPQYALAYAGMADAYNLLGYYGLLAPREASAAAREAVGRCLAIDARLVEGLTARAVVEVFSWNWAAAEQAYASAFQRNPNYVPARYWHALFCSVAGRHEAALQEIDWTIDHDPLSFLAHAHKGWILLNARDLPAARRVLERALELRPDFAFTNWLLGQVRLASGELAEALDWFRRADELAKGIPWARAFVAYVRALQGEAGAAESLIAPLERGEQPGYVSPTFLALVRLASGQRAAALDLLERACEQRDLWLVWLSAFPVFEALREEPRFRRIRERMVGSATG